MTVTTNTRRPGLRKRLLERWTPLFDEEVVVAPLTAEEFAAACGWDALLATGVVSTTEDPLSLADLRLSTIFPRHLLRRRDDGRLVPVGIEEAAGLVRIALAQNGREPGRFSASVSPDHRPAVGTEADAAAPADGDAPADVRTGGDGTDGDTTTADTGSDRRRFFRRRNDER